MERGLRLRRPIGRGDAVRSRPRWGDPVTRVGRATGAGFRLARDRARRIRQVV